MRACMLPRVRAYYRACVCAWRGCSGRPRSRLALYLTVPRSRGWHVLSQVVTGNPHLAVERANRRFLIDVLRVQKDGAVCLEGLRRSVRDPAVVACYTQTLSITDGITDPLHEVLAILEEENLRRQASGIAVPVGPPPARPRAVVPSLLLRGCELGVGQALRPDAEPVASPSPARGTGRGTRPRDARLVATGDADQRLLPRLLRAGAQRRAGRLRQPAPARPLRRPVRDTRPITATLEKSSPPCRSGYPEYASGMARAHVSGNNSSCGGFLKPWPWHFYNAAPRL